MRTYLAAAALAVLTAIPAFAQQQCGSTESFLDYIQNVPQGPERVFEGQMDGNKLEIWADAAGRFIVVVHSPEGITCSVAAGEGAITHELAPNV